MQDPISTALLQLSENIIVNLDQIKALLDLGANPNFTDQGNFTPLHFAAVNGNVGLAKILLERNANIEARSIVDGRTPIFFAISNHKKEMLEFLLKHRANIESKDNNGRTPLREAVDNNNREATVLLLDKGATAFQVNPNLVAHEEIISNWQKQKVTNTARFVDFFNRSLTPITYRDREKQTLQGHTNSVCDIQFLPDGSLISCSQDNTIKVWDLTSGQCIKTLLGHICYVWCIRSLPDGHLVSGSNDKTIKIWDLSSGHCVQTIQAISNPYTLEILPDGRLVSGTLENTIKIWNLATGQCVQTLSGHAAQVVCLEVLPDNRLVSGSHDNTIKIWDLSNGQCLQTLHGHTLYVNNLKLLPDGRLASSSTDNTIKVWDLISGQCIKTLQTHSGFIQYLPDGRLVSGSDTIKVWNLMSGQCIQTIQTHQHGVSCLQLSNDGKLASGSSDKTIKIWNPENFRLAFDAVEVDSFRENVTECKMQ